MNFSVGDFVLVAIVTKRQHKLHAMWKGPYRIIEASSSHVFTCKNLVDDSERIVHVRRMKFFASSDMNVSVELLETISAQDNWATEFIPDYILDSYCELDGEVLVKVKWLGFDILESTWESIDHFYEDAPDLVDKFLAENRVAHNDLRQYVEHIKRKNL